MWIFIPIVIVLILLVIVFLAVFGGASWSWLGKEQRHKDELESPEIETLRYPIPVGQDGAVVIAALRKEGFDAVADHERGGEQDVLIACPQGRERVRAQVRSIIQEETRVNMSHGDETTIPQVRFADEQNA